MTENKRVHPSGAKMKNSSIVHLYAKYRDQEMLETTDPNSKVEEFTICRKETSAYYYPNYLREVPIDEIEDSRLRICKDCKRMADRNSALQAKTCDICNRLDKAMSGDVHTAIIDHSPEGEKRVKYCLDCAKALSELL